MALRTHLASLRRDLKAALTRRLFVDRRALVALRVALGTLLLTDLLLRARSLAFFYTDSGALPRSALFARYPVTANLSVYTLFGDGWWVGLLFVAAGIAALALALGYRTKAAAICSLVLLVSLHARNPLVLNGGDSLLRRTLLWCLFLPLGSGLLLDDRTRCRHPAAIGLLVQPVVLYVINAVIKLRGDAWPSGRAVPMVFSIDSLTVLLGDRLAAYPELLSGLGLAWIVLLWCSPLLVVATGRRRTVLVGAFASAHAGMALTLGVGLFPFVSLAALLPYLPPGVWDSVEKRWNRTVRTVSATRAGRTPRIARRFGASVRTALVDLGSAPAALRRVLPSRNPSEGERHGAITSRLVDREWLTAAVRGTGRGVAAVLLLVVVIWNAAALGYVDVPETDAVEVTPRETRWDMFAPSPPIEDVWYVAVGTTESGETVDAIHGGDPNLQPSERPKGTYPSARWRKYLEVVRWSDDDALRERFASALCTRWNANHRTHVEAITVHVMSQPTRLNGTEPIRESRVRTHAC